MGKGIHKTSASSQTRPARPRAPRTVPVKSTRTQQGLIQGEVPNIKREFILTPTVDQTLDEAMRIFWRATGTSLTRSHLVRAIFKIVQHALPEIESHASHLGHLKRPRNTRGKEPEREKYEAKIASAIAEGIRAARPMK